jgi:hypothetical protein
VAPQKRELQFCNSLFSFLQGQNQAKYKMRYQTFCYLCINNKYQTFHIMNFVDKIQDYDPPRVNIIHVCVELGFTASGDPTNTNPDMDWDD